MDDVTNPNDVVAIATLTLRGRCAVYRYAGATSGPALLLLHGIPTSSYLWRHCLPGLARDLPGWRVIAPDLPGYGGSAPWPGAGPRQCAAFVAELLQALGVERFIWVGHDLGGLVALTDAVRRAHSRQEPRPSLERLILLDTTIYPTAPLVAGLLPAVVPLVSDLALAWIGRPGRRAAAWRRQRYLAGMRALLAPGTALTPVDEATYAEPYTTVRGWREVQRTVRGLAWQAPFVLGCAARLGRLRLPTALIWGARDPFFPLATAERLRRAIPGAVAPVRVLPAGHFPQEDCPAAVVAAIVAFLHSTHPAPC